MSYNVGDMNVEFSIDPDKEPEKEQMEVVVEVEGDPGNSYSIEKIEWDYENNQVILKV